LQPSSLSPAAPLLPAFLHDLHRKSRRGAGTHEAAMRGLRLLQENNIPFHVIAVITRDALGHAEEIYDFFESCGVERLGFNIEEVEANNAASSLQGGQDSQVRAFYETIFRLQNQRRSMTIREFAAAEEKIRSGVSLRSFDFPWFNEQVRPFGIVSLDWKGNFSTYSPELLGMSIQPYGEFSFGNVTDNHFADALETSKFREVLAGNPTLRRVLRVLWLLRRRRSSQQVLRKWLLQLYRDTLLPLLSTNAAGHRPERYRACVRHCHLNRASAIAVVSIYRELRLNRPFPIFFCLVVALGSC
jgi:hypothetical protein